MSGGDVNINLLAAEKFECSVLQCVIFSLSLQGGIIQVTEAEQKETKGRPT